MQWSSLFRYELLLSESRNSLNIMETDDSLLCSQYLVTSSEPDESSPNSHPVSLILSFPSTPKSSSYRLPSGFPTRMMYVFLFYPMFVTRPVHFRLLNLIFLMISGKKNKLWSFSLLNFPSSCNILLRPNVLPGILFPNTLCSDTKFHVHIET